MDNENIINELYVDFLNEKNKILMSISEMDQHEELPDIIDLHNADGNTHLYPSNEDNSS